MTTLFHITGGLGKHILASSVINSYKDFHPEKNVIVSSAYPIVFDRNPNVVESINLANTQYFYKNYIHGKDIEIFAQEPYRQTSHITKSKHLIDTWCDMIDIPNTKPPTIHINFREREYTANILSKYGNKPILVFQPFGGMETPNQSYCWARDLHPTIAQQICDMLHEKYTILHICNPSHPTLQNCVRIDDRLPAHILFAILGFSSKRILIDSCLQHAAFAMGLPSVVIWNVTSPRQFGYSTHLNILPKNSNDYGGIHSYLFNYEIGGIIEECPYMDYTDMFDVEEIISCIEKNF